MTVSKLQLPAKDNAVQLKINEIIDNLGGGGANTDLSNLTATGEAHFQEPLVSGTNIKTINSVSLLSSGNLALQTQLISGTNIKTINNTSVLGNGNISVQEPLVSGTNIKTINSTSLLGSGNISVLTSSSTQVASSRFDGQWVRNYVLLADGVSMGNASSKTYSLTTYLPDSTYDYEVMFSGLVLTASSSGKFLKMILGSSVVANVWVCDARTRTSSTMEATGSCIIPISKHSQQIVMNSESSSNSSGTMSLAALAYRRIGTNT